jgi:hypothetical protein
MYYSGVFKGELKVNGKVLATGLGLEDIFWVKTNSAGAVVHAITYGSPNVDLTIADNLVTSANQLFFIARSADTVHFGNHVAIPYQTGVGAAYSNYIVSTDTAGSVKWITRTNASLVRLYAANKLIHAVASLSSTTGAIKLGSDVIFDSIGKPGLLYMVFDTTGQLRAKKTVLLNSAADRIAVQNVNGYSKGSLFFLVRMETVNGFSFNGQLVGLPSSYSSYHVAIKTDTSFTNFTAKVLNPSGHTIDDGLIMPNNVILKPLPVQLAGSDSLYLILNPLSGTGSYAIDGFTIPFNKNVLAVMDSTLTVKRIAMIGSSLVAGATSTSKRRVFYRNILPVGNTIYFTGQYVGTNEAPMNVVPVHDTLVPIIGASTGTVDLNGPSKSFVAKSNLSVTTSKLSWYGDHRPYESANVFATFLHEVPNERIAFVQNSDNVWNHFIVDSNLAILNGAMTKNADRAEYPRMLSFFSDGSRIVLVSAAGRTALDSGATIPSNSARLELCLTSIKPNGAVKWFKRIQTTFLSHEVRRLQIKNDKAYFLVNFTVSQNDSNFIKVDNQLYAVSARASLLASVDSTGNMVAVNLPNVYKDSLIMDFSFFPNGDIGILATANPGGSGPVLQANRYSILRVNPLTGASLGIRNLIGTALGIYWMEIDGNNSLFFSMRMNSNSPSVSVRNLYLNNGTSTIDSIQLTLDAGSPSHQGLLKMNWDKLVWSKRFYGAGGATLISQNGLFLINNRPVLAVLSINDNQPLYWETQFVHNGPYAGKLTLVGLDTAGNLIRSRYVSGYSGTYLRKGSGERLYLSGSISAPTMIDTIQIGNAGLGDALGLVLDSNFVAKKSFRLGSYYSEAMYDMDIYRDSVAAFTYLAQIAPQFFANRISRAKAQGSDLDPDAFLTTILLSQGPVTGIRNPPPANNWIRIMRNPVLDHNLTILTQATQTLPSTCMIYSSTGQLISTSAITIAQGKNSYDVSLPKSVQSGVYYVVVLNHQWQTGLSFIVQR